MSSIDEVSVKVEVNNTDSKAVISFVMHYIYILLSHHQYFFSAESGNINQIYLSLVEASVYLIRVDR